MPEVPWNNRIMDDTKITTEDLYGSTSTQPPAPVNPAPPAPPAQATVPVEETPEIPMDTAVGTSAPPPPMHGPPPPPPMPKVSRSSPIIVIIFLILFGAGILLSRYIRPFFTGTGNGVPQTQTPTPVPIVPADVLSPTPVMPLTDWKTLPIAGLSYKLPPDVLEPTCDGVGCVSYGTYLPGGTRLTVSSKTVAQPLSSLRGAIITDAAGTAFTSNDTTISGHVAIEFYGTFAGRTTGGFGFAQMHGFMIEVGPTTTLEVNHFTPTGVTADFAADDALFNQIVSTFDFSSVPTPAPTSEN